MSSADALPRTIAIAGAWGYIGRKVLEASLARGVRPCVYDPGPPPEDLDLSGVEVLAEEEALYRRPADLFHLALHPQHRVTALRMLLQRAAREPLLVLVEKPMAEPERPEDCQVVIDAVEPTQATFLYDFPELFEPMTHAITAWLARFGRVRIDEVTLYRGKDREDPQRPRNYKTMVHIQYQESVHCLAFLLSLLGHVRGGLEAVFAGGLHATARSLPYAAPNPQAYPYVVDGQVRYQLQLGETRVQGMTDFKAGAEFAKRKVIRGTADGRPFVIEADHFEGRKYLRIDGQDQGFAPDASSYESILGTLWQWRAACDRGRLMSGAYPNPRFTRLTYQLSGALWHSCWTGQPVSLSSAADLVGFRPGFAAAVPQFAGYGA